MLFVYGPRLRLPSRLIGYVFCILIGIRGMGAAAQTALPTSNAFLGQDMASSSLVRIVPNDPLWNQQWYLRQIGADSAWTVTTGTPRVIVGIIDVGIDITHPDLQENIWVNPNERAGDGIDDDANGFIDDVHGWNFVNGSEDVRPMYGSTGSEEAWSHGTMVASLIGAKGNDGLGMTGVAWNIRLMPLVTLDGNGSGSTQDIIRAIRYAIRMKVDVINLSLAGYEQDPGLTDAVHQAVEAGIMVVGANGNSDKDTRGINIDEMPSYPACGERSEDAIIGVGGTNTRDQKAPYANFGTRCTDISAPGFDLLAARPSYARDVLENGQTVANYREGVGGTSLASPLVAGAAALLKSVHPTWTVTQIQTRLYNTADALSESQSSGTKTILGYGRLNIGRALMEDVASVGERPLPSSAPLLLDVQKKRPRSKIPDKFLLPLQAFVRKLK